MEAQLKQLHMKDLKKNDTGGFDNFDYRGPNKAQYLNIHIL